MPNSHTTTETAAGALNPAAAPLRSAATVTLATDPALPARTAYCISGPTAAVVQDAIDLLMRTVDGSCGGDDGTAQFAGPIWTERGWIATGVITKFGPEVVS